MEREEDTALNSDAVEAAVSEIVERRRGGIEKGEMILTNIKTQVFPVSELWWCGGVYATGVLTGDRDFVWLTLVPA